MMRIRTQIRDSRIGQVGVRLVLLCLLFGAVAGCAAAGTQPVEPTTAPPATAIQPVDPTTAPPAAEATLPSGWESYTHQGSCAYTISHPADMSLASEATHSWIFNYATTEPSGPVPNFIYISVIPADFQSNEPGAIYNYDPAETQTLLGLQIGESRSMREDPNLAPSFTYTRLADTILGNQTAQTYENAQPWEFPAGTKEIRYYLQGNGCTYLIGGYMAAGGSGEPGTINQELFDEVMATFQVNP